MIILVTNISISDTLGRHIMFVNTIIIDKITIIAIDILNAIAVYICPLLYDTITYSTEPMIIKIIVILNIVYIAITYTITFLLLL